MKHRIKMSTIQRSILRLFSLIFLSWTGIEIASATGSWSRSRGTSRTLLSSSSSLSSLAVRHVMTISDLRGGGGGGGSVATAVAPDKDAQRTGTPKKKKKKKKAKTMEGTSEWINGMQEMDDDQQDEKKRVISAALKEKDAAEALGDAIRARADQWRSSNEYSVEQSIASVGWALGTSDPAPYVRFTRRGSAVPSLVNQDQQQPNRMRGEDDWGRKTATVTGRVASEDDEAGGVEAAPTSVLVHYFLKSHGGAHALQCICSLLATLAGLGAIATTASSAPSSVSSSKLALVLLQRCMLFAMVKHVAGLFAAAWMAARALPVAGFRQARAWMQSLAQDPISQYVFYTAAVQCWLPSTMPGRSWRKKQPDVKKVIDLPPLWWQSYPSIPFLLVGPVVLREFVSSALIVSDVLFLWACSSSGSSSAVIKPLLKGAQALVNATMSILVTPTVWRSAQAAERQAILAKLCSKISLAMEVAVGVIMVFDTLLSLVACLFGAGPGMPGLGSFIKRVLCARLYCRFLWLRKGQQIQHLATSVRGGAAQFPFYVIQILLDPSQAMGLTSAADTNDDDRAYQLSSTNPGKLANQLTWLEYLRIAFS